MTLDTEILNMEIRVHLYVYGFVMRYFCNVLYFSLHFHELYYSSLVCFKHVNSKVKKRTYSARDS